MTTFVASPPWMTPTLLVPRAAIFLNEAVPAVLVEVGDGEAAMAIALTPCSGRLPAWLARPSISIVMR